MKTSARRPYHLLILGCFLFLPVGLGLAQDVDWHRSDSNNDGVVDHQDLYNLHQVWQVSGPPLSQADSVWSVVGDDIYRFDGNVGIGTSTPNEKLDVRGAVRSDDPEGNGTATLYADTYGGIMEVANPSGTSAARMWVLGPSGAGLLTLNDPDGNRLTSLFSDDYGGVTEIKNATGHTVVNVWTQESGEGLLTLYDSQGTWRTSLTGDGELELYDSQGYRKMSLYSDPDGGFVDAENSAGALAASLWVGPSGAGFLTLHNPQGEPRVQGSVNSAGSGDLRLDGPNGNENVSLASISADANRGVISVSDPDGTPRAQLYVDENGDGQLALVNSKATSTAGIGTDDSGRSIVWAGQSCSVADHPSLSGSKIVYSSLEGREAAIYCRGSVQLEQGRAVIELPEDFVALASPGTLTVQLTPGSLSSKGLAFETLGKDRIEIGELNGGTGSYPVHYLVHAQRAGYEDHKAVVSAKEFSQAFPAPAALAAKPMTSRRPVSAVKATARSTLRKQ